MKNSFPSFSLTDEADELVRNATLVTELEPYMDDAITSVNYRMWRTKDANEFLESMLDWELAPILPICQWFNPPLSLPSSRELSTDQVSDLLKEALNKLYEVHIVLECTDHLSDEELYNVIKTEILPLREKKIVHDGVYTHWNLARCDDDESLQVWLSYYATEDERCDWEYYNHEILPPKREPLYPRDLPRDPRD